MAFNPEQDDKKNENAPVRRRRRAFSRRPVLAVRAVDASDNGENSEAPGDESIPSTMPVLPLRDVAVFNYMIVPLFVGRASSVQAVEAALTSNRYLFLCTQRDTAVEEPGLDDLYPTGSVAQIIRILKMPDGHLKALVQGISRGRIVRLYQGPPMTATVELLPERTPAATEAEQDALSRFAREQCERILSMRGLPAAEIMNVLGNVSEPGRLADLISANLRLKVEEAQELLECLEPMARLRLVVDHLVKEAEVASMQAKIQTSAREGMDKAQRDYFLREQLKAIRKELGSEIDADEDLDELTLALEKAELPPDARKEADKQLRRLTSMHADSAEATVARTYLEWLSELPWNKSSEDVLDIPAAKTILDEDHHGLAKIKDRILEYLSVRKLNPDTKGPILCFAGPPGVGKTSLGRSIARAIGRQFQRISLGGLRDEAEIRGHRRTYIGAMPGRIIQALKQAGTRNPVLMLDEIDKLGSDFRGDPSSALLEALDPEQNANFSDHYLNLPFDLSKVLFICTANHLENVPGPLRDRLEIITLPGYTQQEKLAIARTYLVPRQETSNGLTKGELKLADPAINRVIREYTREAGLRNLEREIGSICRKIARKKAEGASSPFRVSATKVPELLGPPRFLDDEREKHLAPGVALGLAWTPAGGEVLHVEASVMKGKGSLATTGQLGDVMKESAQAALSFIRSRADKLNIAPDFMEKNDFHIHVPAGATPKDGPSAGITLVASLVSALSGRPVRSDLCMTGEITLQGRILPVGGIKEKILAGVAYGLTHALIPARNAKDLEDIPNELRERIQIHLAQSIDEALPLIFGSSGSDDAPAPKPARRTPAKTAPGKAPSARRAAPSASDKSSAVSENPAPSPSASADPDDAGSSTTSAAVSESSARDAALA